jgi:DNA-binding NarL/FixJ family response regulator
MVIVDGVTALMSNARDESWVERRAAVVDSLHESADELWTAGTAMRDVMPVVVPGGPAWERHELVLRLLADGLTDEMVARRLGVSVRTVRNDVACTMSALDANSRFQAGARAAQLGLV